MVNINGVERDGERNTFFPPTIHINGSSRSALVEQYENAIRALRNAEEALHEATPNGRDYYPQGPDAITHALAQHTKRVATIRQMRSELESVLEAIEE